MQNGKIIFNNLQSLNEKELMAINTYENGTRKDFRNIFENYFENEYESFSKFKQSLFQKAKGTSNITVSSEGNFVNALDKAFMESSIHDVETYRKFKPQFDEMFTHLGKTEKAQDMILDYIANGANIDSDEIMKANAKYFDNKLVNHGLYGFPSEMYSVKGPTDNPLQRIKSNIQDIMSDNSIELSLSSYDYMVGPIGLSGTVDASVYHTGDIRSHVDWNTGKRIYQPNNTRGTGTVDDIIDHIERGSTTDYFHKHDELIGSNFKPESLWVKEDFYTQNKDYVHSLLEEYNIKNLDLIHANENIEKINPKNIERINVSELQSNTKKYKPTKGPKLKQKVSNIINDKLNTIEPQDIIKQSNPKYYTQDQLNAIFNFEHKNTAQQSNETRYKQTWIDEAGEHSQYTNFDEFQKIGGNKSFTKFTVSKEHQEIVKKYWNLLNKVDGNIFIAAQESTKIFNEIENAIIDQYSINIHKAFTEYATNGKYNDINLYMKNNKEIHDKLVSHYFNTGEILDNNTLVSKQKKPKKYKTKRGPKLKEKVSNITSNIINNTTPKTKKYKPVRGPKLKQIIETTEQAFKKTIEQTTNEMTNNAAKKVTKALPKKSLNGGGKWAIGLAVAGLVVGGIIASSDEDKKKKAKKEKNQQINNNQSLQQPIDNTYAMQMAQDISSYRYGKHMTGFVNH